MTTTSQPINTHPNHQPSPPISANTPPLSAPTYSEGLNVPLTPLRFLQRSAGISPNKTACIDGPRRITFRQFETDAQALARALRADGVHPGDRVGVLAANSYEALLAQFAIPLAGAAIVAINTRLAPAEVNYILNHAEIDVILAEKPLIDTALPGIDRALRRIVLIAGQDGEEPAAELEVAKVTSPPPVSTFTNYLTPHRNAPHLPYRIANEHQVIAINYTSGTTGKPKGVVYTHRGAYLNALGEVHAQKFTKDTVYLWTLPMFHCSGWCTGWAAMAVTATQIALRAVRGPEMWRLINEENVNALCGAPAVLTTLVDDDAKRQVSNLSIVTAGAPPSPTIITRCENLGVDITHVYGLTESYGPYTVCEAQPEWQDMPVRRRALLKARQGVALITNEQVRVIKTTTPGTATADLVEDVPADGQTMGEIVLDGNGVMAEYFRDAEATAEAFRGGVFHTGDLGVKHPDGYIQLLDRAKDVIVSGGENISTIEVEQAIVTYPDVSDCAVIGVPDAQWGERPRAYVVLRPEALNTTGSTHSTHSSSDTLSAEAEQAITEAIIAHCRAHIAGYKVPRDIHILTELPRTSTGKVRKNELREKAWASHKGRIN